MKRLVFALLFVIAPLNSYADQCEDARSTLQFYLDLGYNLQSEIINVDYSLQYAINTLNNRVAIIINWANALEDQYNVVKALENEAATADTPEEIAFYDVELASARQNLSMVKSMFNQAYNDWLTAVIFYEDALDNYNQSQSLRDALTAANANAVSATANVNMYCE